MSEYKIVSIISENKATDNHSQIQYNAIMISVNKLINQLSVDMIAKNNLNEYQKINNFVNKTKSNLPKKLFPYAETLKEIDILVVKFFTEINKALPMPTYADITGIGTLAEASITSARDFRAKKITDIITILKELKLKSISDLSKKDEPKK
jgi:hypothetical protein